MNLVHDYIHPTPHRGRCRVRLYLPEEDRDAPVVVCTEQEDNPVMSITNAAERIVGEVLDPHKLPGLPVVWIEHYENGSRGTVEDPHTFDLVLFSSYEVEEVATRWRIWAYMPARSVRGSVSPLGRLWTGEPWKR
jgi:hypothetical protein